VVPDGMQLGTSNEASSRIQLGDTHDNLNRKVVIAVGWAGHFVQIAVRPVDVARAEPVYQLPGRAGWTCFWQTIPSVTSTAAMSAPVGTTSRPTAGRDT
jgi:hypothetical protein